MKKASSFILLLILNSSLLFSQVAINADGNTPDNSALLDLQSTGKGMLIPRMTKSQVELISNPANGLQVFCTTDSKMYIYVATVNQWKELAYGTGAIVPCGYSIVKNHTAGDVAPIIKTVTYGTVSYTVSGTPKCWITSNLGANRQATGKEDATEESAGWYWQFNRKQGFKHDGTTRTPGDTWITTFDENSDWTAANDPCTIELGGGWRLPTVYEWINVDGGWGNWDGPWNSDLKIHAAGCLYYTSGSIAFRGSLGLYWSSTQQNNNNGYYLYFSSTFCDPNSSEKAYGFPIRCLRD